jgi:hypothetical protein
MLFSGPPPPLPQARRPGVGFAAKIGGGGGHWLLVLLLIGAIVGAMGI